MIIRHSTQQANHGYTTKFAISSERLELQQQCNTSCNHSIITYARWNVRKLLSGNTPAGPDLSRTMKTVYARHRLEHSAW